MTKTLTLVENDETITYSSLDGMTLEVRKVDDFVDVRQRIPVAIAGMTCQDLRDGLASRVIV